MNTVWGLASRRWPLRLSVRQRVFGSHLRMRGMDCGVKLPLQAVTPDGFGDGHPG